RGRLRRSPACRPRSIGSRREAAACERRAPDPTTSASGSVADLPRQLYVGSPEAPTVGSVQPHRPIAWFLIRARRRIPAFLPVMPSRQTSEAAKALSSCPAVLDLFVVSYRCCVAKGEERVPIFSEFELANQRGCAVHNRPRRFSRTPRVMVETCP